MSDLKSGPLRRTLTVGDVLRDRLLLFAAASAVSALLLSYFFVAERLAVSNDAQLLLLQTVGLALFAGSIRRTSPWRRRKLRLRWPLIATAAGLLLGHAATVGTLVILQHPHWRMRNWEALTVTELAIFGVMLSWVDEYCTMDHRPKLRTFLARHMRIASGHIDR